MPEVMSLNPEADSVVGCYQDVDGAWWIWEGSIAPEPHTIRAADPVLARFLDDPANRTDLFTLTVTVDDPPRQTIGYVMRANFLPEVQTVSGETVSVHGKTADWGLDPLMYAWEALDKAFWQYVDASPLIAPGDDPTVEQIERVPFNMSLLMAHTQYAIALAAAFMVGDLLPIGSLWTADDYGNMISSAEAALGALALAKNDAIDVWYQQQRSLLDQIIVAEGAASRG